MEEAVYLSSVAQTEKDNKKVSSHLSMLEQKLWLETSLPLKQILSTVANQHWFLTTYKGGDPGMY